tara:strand:+ start:160 stop:393 length:234 start_codon:yes stop_codon:yes gene_type:complete
MPKKTTKEVKETDRESLKQQLEEKKEEKWYGVSVTLTPVQKQQLDVLSQLAHNKTPEEYTKAVLLRHIADRLYLVQR